MSLAFIVRGAGVLSLAATIAAAAYSLAAWSAGPFDGNWAGPLKRVSGPCGAGEMKLTVVDGKVTGTMSAPNRLGEETPGDVTGSVGADGASRLNVRSKPAGQFEYALTPQFTATAVTGPLPGTFCKFELDLKRVK